MNFVLNLLKANNKDNRMTSFDFIMLSLLLTFN